ncbi:MAG: tetratricopeptide repeat protein [Bacteroidia bacterium]|nr:tetratricopeptide repeat protein [Bacteroidia bacterium]
MIASFSFFTSLASSPFNHFSKDTIRGMMIINEDNDSVIYNPDKGKTDKNKSTAADAIKDKENLAQIDKFQKSLRDAERRNNKKEMAALMDSIAAYYSKQKNYREAVNYLQKSAKLKEEMGDKRSAAKTLNNMASALFNAGKYDESIKAYNDALRIRSELKDKEEEAVLLKELANVYQYTYQVDEAIHAYQKSMKIKKELNDQRGITTLINDIGNIYFENNKLDKAISYFEQNLELEKKSNDKANIASSLNNLGIAYLKQGDYVKAENLFQKALEIYKEINDKKGISTSLNNLANIYYNLKDLVKSLENYEQAIKIKVELRDEYGIALLKHNIGNIYKEKGDHVKALRYFQESWETAKKKNYQDLIAKNMYALSQVYFQLSEFKKAYENFKQFIDIKQLLQAEDKETQLSELQVKYSQEKEIVRLQRKLTKQDLLARVTAERNKQEIMIRDLQLKEKENEVKRQRIFNISAAIVLLIILVFSFIFYRQFKKLKKANRLLWTQKNEIDTKRKELELVNTELEKLSIVASKTDNAIVIMDKNGKFEWVNEGFTRLYGFTLETLIAQRGLNIISASANPNVKIAVMGCLKQKSSVNYESHYPDIHGNKIWAQTTLTPIIDKDGNIIKLVAIDTDITRIKTAEEEIMMKNDLLEAQRDEIKKQRDIATRQRDEIAQQKVEITDGIIYAQHIQTALLPPDDYITERLPQHFMLYLPRDIVSGDFYWVKRVEHQIIFTAADCTGHGVPAALMSMLGSTLLSEIVNNLIKSEHTSLRPDVILNELRDQLIKSLHQTGKMGGSNDGMDMALCIYDTTTLKIQYAGANNPIYIIPVGLTTAGRSFPISVVPFDDDLPGIEVKPDKMPIGIHQILEQRAFTNHEIQLVKGDTIYLFSDGYIDQFGGPKYIKYRSKRFKRMLIEINKESMEKQREILDETLKKWRGSMEQIDDVLVFGVKF